MLKIQPSYLSFNKLLATRLFKIPDYQRAYSWTKKQRNDLFDDIKKTHSKDSGHFMAAIVCLRRKSEIIDTDEFHIMDVVDGQQRLTTLILLLKAISLKDKTKEKRFFNELESLLIKQTGSLLLLNTNHDSSHYFVNFIRRGNAPDPSEAKTISDRELLNAIKDCNSFVEEWIDEYKDISSLISCIKNRLYFLLHEIEDEQSVYSVFEVLNSRGLDVSWFDRMKSILMGDAFALEVDNKSEIIDELHKIWKDIYSCIGLRQGMNTEALRFAATLKHKEKQSRPISEENSVQLLHDLANSPNNIIEIAHWLLDVTQACDKIKSDNRLNSITDISQARLLAVAIYLRKDLKKQERDSLLKSWEKVTFRIFGMLKKDTRFSVGEYVRLAWEILNSNLSVADISNRIKEIGEDFTIEDAVNNLRKADCYSKWKNEFRYLLFRYEEFLAKKNGQNFSNKAWEKIWLCNPADSIEHIWSQKDASEDYVHWLGNLMLLPPRLNSKLQDKSPSIKSEDYKKTGLLTAYQVVEMIEAKSGKWNKTSIVDREKIILEWAITEWAD